MEWVSVYAEGVNCNSTLVSTRCVCACVKERETVPLRTKFMFLSFQVLEAHKHGFGPTVGYELNPWLVRLANFHAWRAGHYGKVSYWQEDLWKV